MSEIMKTIEQLKEDLDSAIGGGNTGDIEAAASILEAARYVGLIEAAKAVVATAHGNTYGLTEADMLEANRMAADALQEELEKLA